MERRTAVAVALAALLATSGCLGFLSGPVTFTANKATVSQQALQETGYSEESVQQMVVTRNFSAAGQTKTVKVTNWQATYHRTVNLGPLGEREAAVFAVFSTPQVKVLGRTFNPVSDYNNTELVKLVQQQYQGLSDVREVSSYQHAVLGHDTQVTKFAAKARMEGGASVDVYVHVTKVQDGDDYVVAIAVYPQQLDEGERVRTLLSGVQHSAGNESG